MTAPKWHKGPPPSVGWWPASCNRKSGIYRWWDGDRWSHWASSGMRKDFAALLSANVAETKAPIEWHDRPANWPARSRT